MKMLGRQLLLVGIFLMAKSGSASADTLTVRIERRLNGVMHPLSCHCPNAALGSDEEGAEVPICFAGVDAPPCDKMVAVGQFKEHANNPDVTSPCPREIRKLFFVSSYECRP